MIKTKNESSYTATINDQKEVYCMAQQVIAEMKFPYNAFNNEASYCDIVIDNYLETVFIPARKK